MDHRQPARQLRRLRMQKLFLKNLKLLQLKFGPSHELASNTVHRPAVQLRLKKLQMNSVSSVSTLTGKLFASLKLLLVVIRPTHRLG
jgi:hypothetical protein